MISLEIIVNGQRRTVAGDADAVVLNATISLYPTVKDGLDGWLDVSGSIISQGQPSAEASWFTTALGLGDKVEVHLVDSEEAQAPKLSRSDPMARATDDVPAVCAFCEKSYLEVEGMISSRKAMICRGCVEYLHEMMHVRDDED